MTPIEITLAAIALTAHIVSVSVTGAELAKTIQAEQAAQQTETVYTYGDPDALSNAPESASTE